MKKSHTPTGGTVAPAADVRQQAEETVARIASGTQESLSPEAVLRLLRELRVHPVEPVLPDEELRRTQAELAAERQRSFDLENCLQEKEFLLKEVHHRIKNNISTMLSMLALQLNMLKDQPAAAALRVAKSRFQTMGVLYDKLYSSPNMRELSIRDYLASLIGECVGLFPNKASVHVDQQLDDFMLPAKVVAPLGILVNEIVANAMKYAFAGRTDGTIWVSATIKDRQVTIIVADNGVGLPETVDFKSTAGLGLKLVDLLTSQIGGSIRIERQQGTRFILEFKVNGVR